MKRPLAAALASLWLARACFGASPEEVDAAIRRGVEYLYKEQNKYGNWERNQQPGEIGYGGSPEGGQWGGRTALFTYALLASGERAVDPRITKAVEWLREIKMTGTYALGIRANVWANLPQTKANVASLQKDAALLAKSRSNNPANKSFFTYQPGGANIDLSCSQYGVLGSWAAAQRVNTFDVGYWSTTETAWHTQQNADGGWSYTGLSGGSTIAMTTAGVASLLITQDFAHPNDDADPLRAAAAQNAADAIERGLAWIGQNLPEHLRFPMLYALYGVERVGVASGRKYIGNVDWYNTCADVLLRLQQSDGSWAGTVGMTDPQVDTAFALLFLSRGREPVMMSKLEYDLTGKTTGKSVRSDWNLRPRDVANVTRWVEIQTEQRLNWQIVKLGVATIDDFHDSNLLYITGKLPLGLKDDEKALLKQFVEEGGILVGNAEAGDRFFAQSFRNLVEELFPGNTFKPLADNDGTTFSRQILPRGRGKPFKVEGLSNGARLFAILTPDGDLSTTFQRRDQARVNAYQFVSNIFLYSIEKSATRFKGQTYIVRPDVAVTPEQSVTLARINYGGQWNPEPGGWRRLSAIARNQDKIVLNVAPVELSKDALANYSIAHLTGTEPVKFTDDQRAELKAFIDKGGLLLVDNCGGNDAFDVAIREELAKLIPDAPSQLLSPLPPEHPIFHSADGKLIEPQYRPFALPILGPLARNYQVRGLSVNGKLAVIYSPQDLSVGMVGQPVDGITGYTPATATALMRRIIELKAANKF